MDKPSNEKHVKGRVSNLKALWAGVTFFCLATCALLSLRQGKWPWAIQWLDSGAVNSNLMLTLDAMRYEIVALLLVGLNIMLFILRRARSLQTTSASQSVQPDSSEAADNTDDKELFSKEPIVSDALSAEQHTVSTTDAFVDSDVQPKQSETDQVQLQIAVAEVDRLRSELKKTNRQLQIACEAKAQFLANMSHELRTPMNGIIGMTDLLLGSTLPLREERFVRSISSSSSSLLSIINDLLDYSKMHSGILQLEYARFSVRDCVEDVCSLLAESAQQKGVELICYVDENVPKHMDGDPARVRQIIMNIVSNAIAFTDVGEVVVRLKQCEDQDQSTSKFSTYQCDVQDTGIGISPEIQQQLFEAFSKGDETSSRDHGGLGMGLAIASSLVSLMDGNITFRSRLNEGSRFSFTMNLTDVDASTATRTNRRSLVGARVLVVDDNETNRTILFHQLSNWGLIVECVESGRLALEALRDAHKRQEQFDVLVLDLHMPHMDGIQLAKAIQLEPDFKDIQAIMLTSALLQIDASELELLGIYKYVSKPARQSVLHDSLASLMPFIGSQDGPKVKRPENDLSQVPRIEANVLLVEDNPVNQDVAMGMLEQLGCHVELANDGSEAMLKSTGKKYDIILMDCQMPRMDGYAASKQIKSGDSVNASTPIIALTANAMDGDKERCLAAGMDDYISKPVRTKHLMLMMEKWVSESIDKFEHSVHSQTLAFMSSGDREGDLPAYVIDAVSSGKGIDHTTDSGLNSDKAEQTIQGSPVTMNYELTTQDELASDDVINMKAIETIKGLQRPGQPDLLTKVANIYFEKTPLLLSQMQSGVDACDYALVASSAHSLKSSSAYLGADSISTQCKVVENAIHNEAYDELAERLADIEKDYLCIESALRQLINPPTEQAA